MQIYNYTQEEVNTPQVQSGLETTLVPHILSVDLEYNENGWQLIFSDIDAKEHEPLVLGDGLIYELVKLAKESIKHPLERGEVRLGHAAKQHPDNIMMYNRFWVMLRHEWSKEFESFDDFHESYITIPYKVCLDIANTIALASLTGEKSTLGCELIAPEDLTTIDIMRYGIREFKLVSTKPLGTLILLETLVNEALGKINNENKDGWVTIDQTLTYDLQGSGCYFKLMIKLSRMSIPAVEQALTFIKDNAKAFSVGNHITRSLSWKFISVQKPRIKMETVENHYWDNRPLPDLPTERTV